MKIIQTLIICGLLLPVSVLHAQTKKIAHRSHSGSDETYSMAQSGNFGLPYRQFPKEDTLKLAPPKQDTAKQQTKPPPPKTSKKKKAR